MRKAKESRRAARRITPVDTMRSFVGDSAFGTVMVLALIFAFLHQRVIATELSYGTGGLWCYMGQPAGLCLAISVVLTFFSAKTRLLPALVPILGLGGIEASIVMFFIIQIRRLGMTTGILGIVQEITMLVFLAVMFVCILMLMLTGTGMKVPSAAGIPTAVAAVLALALFVIRAMYIFSSLITALGRELLVEDGALSGEISWVLRSVAPGSESAVSVYYARLLDSAGIALLLLGCIPLATSFVGFFAEQAQMLKNSRDIPLTSRPRYVYSGYEEYTDDTVRQEQDNFRMTKDGYYVERKENERGKFKRRERTEPSESDGASVNEAELNEATAAEQEQPAAEVYHEEYYDDYVPGEGWSRFHSQRQAEAAAPQQESVDDGAERIKVTAHQAERPAPHPSDPDFWNQYKK